MKWETHPLGRQFRTQRKTLSFHCSPIYLQTFYVKKKVNSADLKVILHLGVFNGYTGHLSITLDLGMIEV